jgi:hypothetical protein
MNRKKINHFFHLDLQLNQTFFWHFSVAKTTRKLITIYHFKVNAGIFWESE